MILDLLKEADPNNSKSHKPKSISYGISKECVEFLKSKGFKKLNVWPQSFVKPEDIIFNPALNDLNKNKVWVCKFPGIKPATGEKIWKIAYTALYMKHSQIKKYKKVSKISEKDIGSLDERTLKYMSSKKPEIADAACVLRIILKTGLRIGSLDDNETGNVGVRTLNAKNVSVKGNIIRLEFIGKSYQENIAEFEDKEVANFLQQKLRSKKPEERVFSCSYGLVGQLMKKINPKKVNPKDLRTYKATEYAKMLLDKTLNEPLPDNPKEIKKTVKDRLKAVFIQTAAMLNNSAAMAKNSYIKPSIITDYLTQLGLEPKAVGYKHITLENSFVSLSPKAKENLDCVYDTFLHTKKKMMIGDKKDFKKGNFQELVDAKLIIVYSFNKTYSCEITDLGIKYAQGTLKESVYDVYHGTDANFNKFNTKKTSMGVLWFSSSKEKILNGDVGAQGRNKILHCQIKIDKPAGWDEYEKRSFWELENMGYDGVILPDGDETTYIAFNPEQVKIIKKEVIKENELPLFDDAWLPEWWNDSDILLVKKNKLMEKNKHIINKSNLKELYNAPFKTRSEDEEKSEYPRLFDLSNLNSISLADESLNKMLLTAKQHYETFVKEKEQRVQKEIQRKGNSKYNLSRLNALNKKTVLAYKVIRAYVGYARLYNKRFNEVKNDLISTNHNLVIKALTYLYYGSSNDSTRKLTAEDYYYLLNVYQPFSTLKYYWVKDEPLIQVAKKCFANARNNREILQKASKYVFKTPAQIQGFRKLSNSMRMRWGSF